MCWQITYDLINILNMLVSNALIMISYNQDLLILVLPSASADASADKSAAKYSEMSAI